MIITVIGTLFICGSTYVGSNTHLKNESKMFYFIVMSILFVITCILG